MPRWGPVQGVPEKITFVLSDVQIETREITP